MEILEKILTDKLNRKQLMNDFQEAVWEDENDDEVLSDLAYQFNFYEPNDLYREEDLGYFGDDRLEEIIKEAIEKLSQ